MQQMKVLTLKDSKNNIFTPKVSADSVYLSGSKTTLTTRLAEIQNTFAPKEHLHEVSDVTSLQEFVDERIGAIAGESLDRINGEVI